MSEVLQKGDSPTITQLAKPLSPCGTGGSSPSLTVPFASDTILLVKRKVFEGALDVSRVTSW